ncbi:hypothetical protein Fcan01_27431 [Folsomia candida]|uniref:Uncharacterized protein n=1 Tax=Folsomia candida TaxID=158441 RepID=A0A226CXW8_FOLCA|nr:hypothetical protein Fcan01_27431 [Folsomia candida]
MENIKGQILPCNTGMLESFVKSNAFKDSHFGPVHFLVDRVVIRNDLGQVEIEKEKVLHFALNLLAIARDTPRLQDHLGYFVSECQSLVEDHNNFKIKKGIYANKPDLPQQYCPKSFLFTKWGDVSKYQQNVSPPVSREERVITHKFIAARLLVIGDIVGYREHRGCPSTPCTGDVAGRVCDVCYKNVFNKNVTSRKEHGIIVASIDSSNACTRKWESDRKNLHHYWEGGGDIQMSTAPLGRKRDGEGFWAGASTDLEIPYHLSRWGLRVPIWPFSDRGRDTTRLAPSPATAETGHGTPVDLIRPPAACTTPHSLFHQPLPTVTTPIYQTKPTWGSQLLGRSIRAEGVQRRPFFAGWLSL